MLSCTYSVIIKVIKLSSEIYPESLDSHNDSHHMVILFHIFAALQSKNLFSLVPTRLIALTYHLALYNPLLQKHFRLLFLFMAGNLTCKQDN